MISMSFDFYKKLDLSEFMEKNRWNDVSLSKKLTEMGTKISHTGVWYWRHGQTKPKSQEMLKNLTYILGVRAELFFLTESQEKRLKELSKNYEKDAALKILFDYL